MEKLPLGRGRRKRFHVSEAEIENFFVGAVVGAEAEFVEGTVVVAAETLEDVVDEAAVLAGAVGKLVARKVVDADGDEDILVDVKGSGEALDENVSDVVVGVCAIVEFCAKRGLP